MARDYAQEIALLLIVLVAFAHLAYALRRSQDRELARSISPEDAEAELRALCGCEGCTCGAVE